MAIITLANLKAKLGIPASDTSEDTPLTIVLNAAQKWVYENTGYDDTATQHTVYIQDAQIGRILDLQYRPIDTALTITATARSLAKVGSETWETLACDVIDPDAGKILLLGTDAFQTFPPTEPRWHVYRWRDAIWPVAKIVYTTKAKGGQAAWGDDIINATYDIAMFDYRNGQTSHMGSSNLGPIGESYVRQNSIPESARRLLVPYLLPAARWTP